MDTLSTARDLEAAGFERVKAEAITAAIWRFHERAATKADLEPLATKADLAELEKCMATREDLEPLATKAELALCATKADLAELEKRMATKADLAEWERRMTSRMATKAEIATLETRLTNRFYGVGTVLAGIVIAGIKLL